jgi:TRAP-type transport system small permease protein
MSKLWRAYVGAIETFCLAGITTIMIVSAMQVFARYVLHSSLFWSEELMRYAMLWVVAAGAGISFSRGQFLGMRMLVDQLPPMWRRAADIISAVLMLIFLGFVLWFGFKLSWGTRLQTAVALNISMFWIHVSVVAGAALLALHVAMNELLGLGREVPIHDHMNKEDAN